VKETELYGPIKAFLEGQGYTVKGEVGRCDLVAVRDDTSPVIVEMKTGFTLPLVFQGMQRQTLSDLVYLTIPQPIGRGGSLWARHRRDILKLCRRLGLGLLTVDVDSGAVEALLDPAPYQPRKRPKAKQRLLGEFQRRVGDPTVGGGRGRPIMTAYRQDALRCAVELSRNGPTSPKALKGATGVDRAASILQRDVYGWFERIERGVYVVTPKGKEALATFADAVAAIEAVAPVDAADRGQDVTSGVASRVAGLDAAS